MAFSYHWSREEQRKWAEERLFRYLRTYVDRFHPYYRRLFAEQGIDVKRHLLLRRLHQAAPDPQG